MIHAVAVVTTEQIASFVLEQAPISTAFVFPGASIESISEKVYVLCKVSQRQHRSEVVIIVINSISGRR